MVLKRSVPLLQQEEEEFGPDEGIHGEAHNGNRKLKEKNGNKAEGINGGYCWGRFFCHTLPGSTETRNEKTRNSQIDSLIIHRAYRERREHKMTFKNRQTLTERTGAFKHRIIGEDNETHLESNNQST